MDPQKFARIAESLRQYRRAELKEFEEELGGKPLDALYVDPLPDDAILNSVLSSNTTFLLGRKGTGKSTVFAQAQAILRSRKDAISTYIDVKSLYDVIDTGDISHLQDSTEVDEGVSRAHMLRKEFLGKVMSELLKEVDNVCEEMSVWDRWSGRRKSYDDLRGKLTSLQTRIKQAVLQKHELPVLQRITRSWKTRRQHEASQGSNVDATVNASAAGPTAVAHATVEDFDKSLDDNELYNEYSDVVLRTFPFAEIITEVQDLLAESRLKRLVVFFDDFSELRFVDQRLFC
jgi:predicted ATP-binding protein involved in virulence